MNLPLECALPKKVVVPAQQSHLCLKQVHQSTATCGSLSLGQLQSGTGSFVCLFWEEEKKMGSLSQWGFCYLSWGAQGTQTKYLDPRCLKYLGIALDTMSTHASSVCYSSQLPLCPQHICSIKATVFRAFEWAVLACIVELQNFFGSQKSKASKLSLWGKPHKRKRIWIHSKSFLFWPWHDVGPKECWWNWNPSSTWAEFHCIMMLCPLALWRGHDTEEWKVSN